MLNYFGKNKNMSCMIKQISRPTGNQFLRVTRFIGCDVTISCMLLQKNVQLTKRNKVCF